MNRINIGTTEWILLYLVFGIIDVLQFLIGLTGVGTAINVVADVIIGGLIIIYFQMRGVKMLTKFDRVASLLGGFGLEAITGGIAPAWIIDIWLINRSIARENAEYDMEEKRREANNNDPRPLNQDGERRPPRIVDVDAEPLNMDGVRRPKGGLE